MFQKMKKPLNFLLLMSLSNLILLLLWKYISVFYLNIIVILGNPVLSLFYYPLKLAVENNNLQFVYMKINSVPLNYTVYDSGEIFLNITILLSLFSATFFVFRKKIYKEFLISILVIFLIHEMLVWSYAYSHIWNVVSAQGEEVKNILIPEVSKYFSNSTANVLDKINYHWGAWGWDIVPVAIWFLCLKNLFIDGKKLTI